jgi:D-3-phosphoglycerate dehydrogenase
MHDMLMPESLLAIAMGRRRRKQYHRLISALSRVSLFSTPPGANANAVKELVICGLLLQAVRLQRL